MGRAAIYTRLSRKDDEKVSTCASQERRLRAEAERRGLTILPEHVFVDDGISAFDGKQRPGFAALVETVVAGEVDAILAVRMDRISRDEVEAAMFRSECRKARVSIIAEGREYAPDDDAGGLVATIESWSAWRESRVKSVRIREAKEIARERGLYTGGPRAFGFLNHSSSRPEIPKGSLVVVPEEAQALRDAANWILAGRGLRYVAEQWNARGITRPRGGEWDHGQVGRALRAERIAGLYYGRVATWEPILEVDTFLDVGAALTSRANGSGKSRGLGLLSGFLVCDVCGAKLGRKREKANLDGTRRWIYVCRGCERNAASAAPLEEFIGSYFLAFLSEPGVLEQVSQGAEASERSDVRALLRERSDIEQRLGDLLADFVTAAESTRSAVRQAQRAAERRIKAIDVEIAKATPALPVSLPSVGELAARWDQATIDLRRTWLAVFIDHIGVRRGTKTGPGNFDPARLTVVWRI